VGNDLRLEHEVVLFDVAAGSSFLRSRGFKKIVLLGNSGGASLYSLYNQQSVLPGSKRISHSPAGRATKLAELDMPPIDGMIMLAPHPGQGILLMGCIDPSVVEEGDPLSVELSLDAFDPANGFSEPPASSSYSATFLGAYRAAQRARVERLDAIAREMIARRLRAKKGEGLKARRLSGHTPVMTVWRTDADPRCFDLSLDPSDRRVGTLWGRDPYKSNYGVVGFARFCTPESWLSTWSGISSNASLAKTAGAISVPTLLIEYTGDASTFPATSKDIFGLLKSTDPTHVRIRGDHHGRALSRGEVAGRYLAGQTIASWLSAQFAL
jgi:pimeloyl-ACP methyl ester carboxylesterase